MARRTTSGLCSSRWGRSSRFGVRPSARHPRRLQCRSRRICRSPTISRTRTTIAERPARRWSFTRWARDCSTRTSCTTTITATARRESGWYTAPGRVAVDHAQPGAASASGPASLRLLQFRPVRPRHRRCDLAQDRLDDPSLQGRPDRHGVRIQSLDRRTRLHGQCRALECQRRGLYDQLVRRQQSVAAGAQCQQLAHWRRHRPTPTAPTGAARAAPAAWSTRTSATRCGRAPT